MIFDSLQKINCNRKTRERVENMQDATFNRKIYTRTLPESESTFRVLQYNVNQAMECEKHTDTAWGVRADRVLALIKDVDADIVCLQELRHLNTGYLTPEAWLALLKGYRYVVDYANSTPLAMGQAILYKPDRFYAKQHVKYWLSELATVPSDTFGNGYGYIVSGLELMVVDPVSKLLVHGAQPFWVFNTHFGLDEDLKLKSCIALQHIIRDGIGATHFIVCGDLNLFPDRDGNAHRALLAEHWTDCGKGAITLLGQRQVEGTFVGYHYDAFKADLGNMVSRLDHIFCSPNMTPSFPTLWNKTMKVPNEVDDPTTRDFPSDHWPLVVRFLLFQ